MAKLTINVTYQYPLLYKLDTLLTAAVEAYNKLDSVKDSIISHLGLYTFNLQTLVNKAFNYHSVPFTFFNILLKVAYVIYIGFKGPKGKFN